MKFDLTHPQKRIWYIEQLNPLTSMHNISGVMQINEALDVDDIQTAITQLVKEEVVLRLRFNNEKGSPYQFDCGDYNFKIDFKDFSKQADQSDEKYKWILSKVEEPFDLEKDALFRFAVIKNGDSNYELLLVMHHIISDGWSLNLFAQKLIGYLDAEYCEYKQPGSYIEYINKEKEYIGSDKFLKNKHYWNSKFSELSVIKAKISNNISSKRLIKRLDDDIYSKITNEISNYKMSWNTFFIAVKGIYDYKFRKMNDIIYGIPVLNRAGRLQKNTLGMFTSTVPVRFKINGELSKKDLYKNVVKDFKQSLLNQRYPFDLLVQDLELRSKGIEELFDTSINYYIAKSPTTYKGSEVVTNEIHTGEQNYSLQIVIEEKNDSINLIYDYKTDIWSSIDIEKMHNEMLNIIFQLSMSENICIQDVEGLSKFIEKNGLKFKTESLKKIRKTTTELFQDNVKYFKNNPAIFEGDRYYTYKELDELSNQYANYFESVLMKAGDRIAIMLPHSYHLIAIILGIHKIGACYVPIDPEYPQARTDYILKDSDSAIIICDDKRVFKCNKLLLNDIELDKCSKDYVSRASQNDLAYVIYTSGSTGIPKGVMVTHKNLVSYAVFASDMYVKNKNDIFAFYSSIAFDLTVTSIFAPLVSGAALDVYLNDGSQFVLFEVLEKNRANIVKLTPSHLLLIKDKLTHETNIDRFVIGGENLSTRLAIEVCKNSQDKIELFNEYGPTEATVGCMLHKFDQNTDLGVNVPIGVASSNSEILLLDEDLRRVPRGVQGEIFIGGASVTNGYLNKEKLTSESFIWIDEKKYYKTGDYAKQLETGSIDFLGRKDSQVKVRGHRVELEEINNVLLNYQQVVNATTVLLDNRVVSYLVCRDEFDNKDIEKDLKQKLPNYMQPSLIEYVNEIPLTENGKIDFEALTVPQKHVREYVKFENKTQEIFVDVCQKILLNDQISMNDNFYEIGGDSIKAIQIASELYDRGYSLKAKEIMEDEILLETSNKIILLGDNLISERKKANGVNANTPMLTWFNNQAFKFPNHYTQSVLLDLDKSISIDQVKKIMKTMIERHDVFRLNYSEGKWIYRNINVNNIDIVKTIDCSQMESDELIEHVKDKSQEVKKSIDYKKDFLIKTVFFETGFDFNHFLIVIHHLAVDGVSWRILLDEFIEGLSNDLVLEKKKVTSSYQEWAHALSEFKIEDIVDDNLWKFTSYNSVDIRSHTSSQESAENKIVKVCMRRDEFDSVVQKVSEKLKMRVNEILIYSTARAVQCRFGVNNIPIELEHHGRFDFSDKIDVSQTIGWFTMMYPVPIEILDVDTVNNCMSLKDTLRTYEKIGYQYSLHNLGENREQKFIRFNYLGDFSNLMFNQLSQISNLDTGEDSSLYNKSSAVFEVNCLSDSNEFQLRIDFCESRFNYDDMKVLGECIVKEIRNIGELCVNYNDVELSVSDFEHLDMSTEDFESLF